MQITSFVARLAWYVSIPAFLFIFLTAYQQFPETVSFGTSGFTLGKQATFYLFAGLMLLLNVLLLWLGSSFRRLPDAAVSQGVFSRWQGLRPRLNESFTEWTHWGAALSNVLLGLATYLLALDNAIEPARLRWMPFSSLLVGCLLLLAAWVAYLPLRIRVLKP